MVLELRDKLQTFGAAPATAPASPVEEDVISALVNLGYQRGIAERALNTAAKNGAKQEFDVLFREALAALSK